MSDRDGSGRFQTGSNGGPGRPRGSRNRLSEGFLSALCEDFEVHGVETIRRAREADPVAYVRMCAALMPKVLKVDEPDDYAGLTDEELTARIRQWDRIIVDGEGSDWLLRLRDGRDEGEG